MKLIISALLAIFLTQSLSAAVCTAVVGTNNWGTNGTWSCGAVPTVADSVVIPNGATVVLDVDSNAVISVTINAGGELRGDGSGKILLIAGAGTPDLTNNGTLDFSAESGYDAVVAGNGTALDFSESSGSAIWKLSTIDFANAAATFNSINSIEFNGHATPFQNTGGNITGTTGANCPWTFSGSVAQTISTTNITRLAGNAAYVWRVSTNNIVVTNTAGLSIAGAMTFNGDLDVNSGGVLELAGTLTVSGNDMTIGANSTLNLAGTTTAMPTSTNRTFNASSTVEFKGSGNQTIPNLTYGNLILSNAGTKTRSAGTHTIAGDFTVQSGPTVAGTNNPVINVTGNVLIHGNYRTGTGAHTITGNLDVSSTGTLILSRTGNAMPTVSGTKTFDPASTVDYNVNGNQNVSPETYGNLSLTRTTGTRTRTPLAGSYTIVGTFTINASIIWAGNTNNPDVDMKGDFTRVGTFTSGSGTYTFSGTNTQTISAATTWTNMVITNASAVGVSVATTQTITNFTLDDNAVLTLAGTTTAFPTVSGTRVIEPTSTVRFVGTGAQTVPAITYGNILLSANATTKTPAAGTHTIAGNFTLGSGTTYAGNTNNPTVNLAGDFSNSGTFNSGTNYYIFNGTTPQTFTGATTFTRMRMNNTAASVADRTLTLINDLSVATDLNFVSGRVVTGANKVILTTSATTLTGAGSGTGWVAGNLQRAIAAGASSPVFDVGTDGSSAPNLAYSPVNINFTGVGAGGGNLLVYATLGDHPQISTSGLNSAQSVNRWWTLTTSGVSGTPLPAFTSMSLVLNFIASDIDTSVDTNNVFITRYASSTWSTPATGTRTATSTQSTGVTALGEFAIGENNPLTSTFTALTFSDPVNNTTNPKAIPNSVREYTLQIHNPGLLNSADSMQILYVIPGFAALYVNDINGGGSGPVRYIDGTPSSALTYTFTSLASMGDDLEFSDDNQATWTYVPTPDSNGCDAAVTHVRIRPKGSFSTGQNITPTKPNFQVRFRACVL